MTVNDAKIALFNFFSTKELFDLDDDFIEVVAISVNEEVDKEIVAVALKEFEEQKLVSSLKVEEKRLWVLNKPLSQYSQSIELKYNTIQAIGDLINAFCDEAEDDRNRVDPLAISERDIQNLVVLCHTKQDTDTDE